MARAAIVLTLTCFAADAAAEGPISANQPASPSGGIVIEWDAPAECPDATNVRSATARLLGAALDSPRKQRILARAVVHRNAAHHWEVDFSLSSNETIAEEKFAAERCGALADAVALKVALAADVDASSETRGADRARETPASDSPGIGAHEEVAPARTPSGPSRMAVRLAGGADVGLFSSSNGGGALVGSLELAPFRLELGAEGFAGAHAEYASLPGMGATFDLWAGLARGCATPSLGNVLLPICGGVEVGALGAQGVGVEPAYHPYRTWGAFVIGPALRWPLVEAFSLWFEVDATIVLARPSFRVRGAEELYRAPAAGARGWLGVEWAVPK